MVEPITDQANEIDMAKLPPVFVWSTRPRCPACGGVRLLAQHTEQNGDETITRHCRCGDCGRRVHLILE